MRNIGEFIAKNAVALSIVLVLAGLWPISQLPQIRIDNAIDVWLDHQSADYKEYVNFQKEYGNDEWVMVAFSVEGLPENKAKEQIRSVGDDLQKIDPAISVVSVVNADPMTIEALGGLLMSADGKTAGIFLNLSGLGKIENRRAIIQKIDAALAPHSEGRVFHLGGPTLMNAELDRISEHQSRVFMTLASIVATICLYAVFRSAVYAALALAGAGTAVAFTLGTAVGAGMTLNMITTVLPVLILVLSLTGAIHLIHRFRKNLNGGDDPRRALGTAIDDVIKPYALAAATTAIGFLSLLFSHMGPVRDLGLWAAAGISIGFACNMVLIPAVLTLFFKKNFLKKRLQTETFRIRLRPSAIRRFKWPIVAAGFLLLAGPAFLVPSLRVESNVLTFFEKDSRIQRDYQFISRHLTGLSTMEMDFRGPFAETWPYVQRLKEKLEDIPDLSPTVFMSGNAFRMSVFVDKMESMAFNKLVEKVREAVSESWPGAVKTRLTGTVLLLNSVQEELVRTQVESFGIALLCIVVIFIVVFRSAALVMTGTAVNVFPITVLAGAAAVSGIPLNVATIMIASTAIGIAVDDTVFFLARLRSETATGADAENAIDSTLRQMAGPITSTTLVVSMGFFALIPAEFIPVRYFGILGGLTMISAWIGDLILLPALLYAFHSRTGGRTNEPS